MWTTPHLSYEIAITYTKSPSVLSEFVILDYPWLHRTCGGGLGMFSGWRHLKILLLEWLNSTQICALFEDFWEMNFVFFEWCIHAWDNDPRSLSCLFFLLISIPVYNLLEILKPFSTDPLGCILVFCFFFFLFLSWLTHNTWSWLDQLHFRKSGIMNELVLLIPRALNFPDYLPFLCLSQKVATLVGTEIRSVCVCESTDRQLPYYSAFSFSNVSGKDTDIFFPVV